VLAYIRAGEGLALSKTIEKAVEDFETRIDTESSSFDVDEPSLKGRTLQRLLLADATLLLGILVTRIVFRSAMNGVGLQFPPASVARNQ
jgi:predicted component of type VI protein secretion system